MARILAFAGSTRNGSYNHRLVHIAATAAEAAGATVRVISLRDFALPVYDADFEADYGLLENLRTLKRLFNQAQGLLIATPEYNGSLSAVLKNTLDWMSRPPEPPFDGKVVAIMGASGGPVGTARGQYHLRQILVYLNTFTVNKPEVFISAAQTKFNAQGELTDDTTAKFISDLLVALQNLKKRVG